MDEINEINNDVKYHFKLAKQSNDIEEIKGNIEWLESYMKDIVNCAMQMHEGAVSMEKRLMLYRSAIESLGFKRVDNP
jgi:hypothetical protein